MFRASFGNQYVISAKVAARQLMAQGFPVPAEFYRATSYFNPLGPEPGRGWILMFKQGLDNLDLNALHTLELELEDNENRPRRATERRYFFDLVVAREPICLTKSGLSGEDENGIYLVEVTDCRWRVHNPLFWVACNKQYNVRLNTSEYYTDSLNSGVAWTWLEMVQDLWGLMTTQLGAAPSALPFTPHGTPENYLFQGTSAWLALSLVLARIGCAFKRNPETGVNSIVRVGETDATMTAALARLVREHRKILDGDPIPNTRGRVPYGVRVFFQKLFDDPTGDVSNTIYSVDVAGPDSATAESGTYHPVWDDLRALYDSTPALTNGTALTARAQERSDDFYRQLRSVGGERLWERYSGLQNLQPGSTIKGVCWREDTDERWGVYTEIVRHPFAMYRASESAQGGKPGWLQLWMDAEYFNVFPGSGQPNVGPSGAGGVGGEEVSLVSNVCPSPTHLCLAKRTSTLAIPTGSTPTVITLNGEDFDTATMHSTSSNTSRITIQRSGYYRCTGHCEFTDISGGNGVNLSLLLNGAAAGVNDRREAFGGALALDVYKVMDLDPGDYVEMQVAHDYGSDRNITTSTFLLVEEIAAPITVERRDVTVLAASEKSCEPDPQDCCPATGSGGSGEPTDIIYWIGSGPTIDDIVTTDPITISDLVLPGGGGGGGGSGSYCPYCPLVTDDLLLLFIFGSLPGFSGGAAGPDTPVVDDGGSAWNPVYTSPDYPDNHFYDDTTKQFVSIWWKLYAGDPAPTVELPDWPNPSRAVMKIVGFRNVNLSDPIGPTPAPVANGSLQNIGPFPSGSLSSIYHQAVITGRMKLDDWLNALVVTDDNLTFRELLDYPLSDAPIMSAGLDYAINGTGNLTVPEKTVTVNGGGAASGLGFMLAINGVGTSGGAGGGTEACSSCTGGVAAAEYTFTASGFSNGSCSDCANANSTFTLAATATECVWESTTFTLCSGALAFWRLTASFVGVNLTLFSGDGSSTVAAWTYSGAWDCLTSRSLSLSGSPTRCTCPASITVTPV